MKDSDQLTPHAKDFDGLVRLAGQWVHIVHASCYRQLSDTALAEFATATTFHLLLHRGPQLGRRTHDLTWLFDTARQVCRALRASLPASRAETTAASAAGYTPPADWGHIAAHLDEGLARLPSNARSAILLKYFANLPISEVAQSLGRSTQAAGRAVAAGVSRLRRFLESRNQFISPDALVAMIQTKAVPPAPASAIEVLAAAMLQEPDPRIVQLARHVSRSQFRRRIIAVAAALLVSAAAVIGSTRAWHAVAGRVTASTQPLIEVTTRPANPPASRIIEQPPSIAVPNTPWPKTRPVREVDPVFAARLGAAIRRGDYRAVLDVVSRDEGLVNAKDPSSGIPVVELAAELVDWRRPEAVKIAHWLIDNGAVTSIHTAARAGHAQHVLRMLLSDPALLNSKDARGLTPLQRALLNPGTAPECEQLAEYLLAARATVDIWSACTLGRAEDVKSILAKDPKHATQRCQGATPLHWAMRPRRHGTESLAIAGMLAEAGADLRAADPSADGMTPLHAAAEWGDQIELLTFLLDRGVEVNILDDFGWTPVDYAIDRDRRQAAEFLQSRGGKRTTTAWPDQPLKTPRFYAAVRDGDPRQVKILLDDTPDLARARGATGETPMHHAAAIGSVEIIDLLLADKADPNAQETNKFGGTPLHWAVKANQLAAVKHLLSKGADPKLANQRSGQTLLHVAAKNTDNLELIDLLLSAGLDRSVKDRFGKTALQYAQQCDHAAIQRKLESPR